MTIFKEKLPIFQDKSPIICREIFSQSAGSEHKLEIGTSNSSIKEGKFNGGYNTDNKFPADTGLVCDTVLRTAAVLRAKIRKSQALSQIIPFFMQK
jgi:hypothetical protein